MNNYLALGLMAVDRGSERIAAEGAISDPRRVEGPAALRPRNGDPARWQRQRNAPALLGRFAVDAGPRLRDLLLCAKYLFVVLPLRRGGGAEPPVELLLVDGRAPRRRQEGQMLVRPAFFDPPAQTRWTAGHREAMTLNVAGYIAYPATLASRAFLPKTIARPMK